MTTFLSVVFASLMLAACGPSAPPPTGPTPTSNAANLDAAPCEQEIARVCPPGEKDACLFTPAAAETHVCVMDPQPPAGANPSPDGQHSDPQGSTPPGPPAMPPADPASAGTIPCKARIRQICEPGFVDGCGLGVTTVHACVAAGTKAGPPCVATVAFECPAGQVNACALNPPISDKNVCVMPRTK